MPNEQRVRPIRVLALCAGYGGIELGLRIALGSGVRTVGYVEKDAFAVTVLKARMADGTLADAPIYGDVTTFDGQPWRGKVDLVTAGFPCQAVSVMGKGLAQKDPRWLWPHIARIIGRATPELVFIENVPALLTAGGGTAFGEVLGSLADLGYNAEWGRFSAAQVGATHLRERIFLLAHTPRVDGAWPILGGDQGWKSEAEAGDGGGPVGYFPPGPKEHGRWDEVLRAAPNLEPVVRRAVDGASSRLDRPYEVRRSDRLRSLGNGVVPLTAAVAFTVLMTRVARMAAK